MFPNEKKYGANSTRKPFGSSLLGNFASGCACGGRPAPLMPNDHRFSAHSARRGPAPLTAAARRFRRKRPRRRPRHGRPRQRGRRAGGARTARLRRGRPRSGWPGGRGPAIRARADSFAVKHHLLSLTAATSPPALCLDKDIFDVRLDHPIADDVVKTGSGACDLCGSVRQGRQSTRSRPARTLVRRHQQPGEADRGLGRDLFLSSPPTSRASELAGISHGPAYDTAHCLHVQRRRHVPQIEILGRSTFTMK